ncbi:unnamed protein product [Trifolium pratense]|uniref:Uncharacterized protein n=1 Tax=Trifolium pratense TaxID=57577 RepID=A0ACB0K8N3_TRIPR|nr:unnamed protein product [Trifolium pratense]
MSLLMFQPINGISQIFVRTQFPYKKCGRKSFLLRPQAVPSKTQRIMESVSVGDGEVGGAGGAYSYQALKRLDQLWSNICSAQEVVQEPQQVVSTIPSLFTSSDLADKSESSYDVIVCGGTLGIFIATALCARGLRVAVVERNVLKGREQEWNISRKELLELVEVGVLEEDDIERVTSAKFNPNRCGFERKGDIWVNDILNLGVSPVRLIEIVKKRFIALGGVILEGFSVSSINVYEDAAVLKLSGDKILSSRLIIDAMGNFSPVVKQAFPAGSGPRDRTTCMFTYVDPQQGSQILEELLEEYWNLMPEYQFNLLFSNNSKHVPSVSVGCIEKERHALLELKASLVLDDTLRLPTWDSKSTDCCTWQGIVCSNQTGHVEMLDLNGYQFGRFPGEINASLMELQHLKYLNLRWNYFSNSIFPNFFGSLSNLRYLDLRSSFNGGKIPNDLARLSHLQYLDLSRNGFEGTIPHQLGNLSHLQHLDLSDNNLGGTIPHQLGSLSNLQELYLEYNQLNVIGEWLSNLTLLTHLDFSGLPNLNSSHVWLQMIAKIPKIQELKLSQCDLSNLYLHSLSPSLLNFSTSLTILDLSYNTFSSSKIFEWVFNSTSNLTELDLSYNIFKGTIAYNFGNIRNPLERLYLSGNEIHGGILESISDICTLQSLNLNYNNLNEEISTILLKLSGCARYSLQELDLSYNKITGTFPDLSIFPSLITIDLSSNLLSGKVLDGVRFLPSKLESLTFRSNSLEGGIPYSFGNLCSLKSLDLSNNKLSEDLSVILHNMSVGCAKYSLRNLILDANQITGTIPNMSGFSSLKNLFLFDNLLNGSILKNSTFPYKLEVLYLGSNNLKGVISDSHFDNMFMLMDLGLSHNSLVLKFSENWLPPFQLHTLYLSSCILGPSFPKWLHSQKHLQRVDISNSGISDVVPMWFWNQATYTTLVNISYNNIIGTIPNLPIRFSYDCQVILDSNQFEGSIPPFFQSARYLGLSKNKFSEILLLLCTNTTINNLLLLDLSKNQLSTQLPDCWSHLKTLKFLDLSDNTLFGEIPSSMGSLSKLEVLILRNNSLSGKLPISLKNCTNLVMLDLGDNRLSGPIPYWLGQQLQMLSLRKNQFYGSLPHSLCTLRNIQLLDLSENNLSGQLFICLKNFFAMSHNSTSTIDSDLIYRDRGGAFFVGNFDLIAMLTWKGAERQFKNNKLILRSIDFSSNQLTGNIPKEMGNLIELVSLNLSNNYLSGEITSKIGRLTSLEFLDLSRNHFSGLIPPSLAQIDRLSMLNLSDNNLSGRIPIGTQLQSFDASSYEGNADLCGKPLDKICPGDEEVAHQKPETHEESSHGDKKALYLSVALGFITGFWGLWGSLFLSRNWRHKYVLFLNNIIDTMYVFIVLNATKFRVCLRGLQEKFV